MGLSGRKTKQRIPNDPRNLSWADDAARFGSSYLAKFGWDSSKGLGAGGEGRTSHIKVSQKLDMMGIGAGGGGHQNDPDGIAWKQNKDYENLLKRLNEANESGGGKKEEGEGEEEGSGIVVEGFVKAKGEEEAERKKERKEKRKEKKRKREEAGEGKSKKPRKKEEEMEASAEEKPVRAVPRHRSHRARHIAAKSLASKSAVAISEILGIAASECPKGELTGVCEAETEVVENITTSAKSVEEYFRTKMGKAPVAVAEEGEERRGLGYGWRAGGRVG